MSNNIVKIFNNEEFGNIRTVVIDDEPWFVGKDVAIALGYAKPTDTVRKRVDNEDRGISKMETPSGIQEMTIINESGVYALIFSSKLESAKRFKRWVTSEVLPEIRKTGTYTMKPMSTGEQIQLIAKGYQELADKIEQQDEELKNQKEEITVIKEQIDIIGAYQNSYKYNELKTVISSRVMNLLSEPLYRTLWSPYFYKAIHGSLQKQFKTANAKLIPVNQLDDAKNFVYRWKPSKLYIQEKQTELIKKRDSGTLSEQRVAALKYWLAVTANGEKLPF